MVNNSDCVHGVAYTMATQPPPGSQRKFGYIRDFALINWISLGNAFKSGLRTVPYIRMSFHMNGLLRLLQRVTAWKYK